MRPAARSTVAPVKALPNSTAPAILPSAQRRIVLRVPDRPSLNGYWNR
jgi:hypothetical protein